jgi:hypothetical protein
LWKVKFRRRTSQQFSEHEEHELARSLLAGRFLDAVGGYSQLKGSSVRVMWIAYGITSNSWVSYELDYLNITTYQTAYAVSVGDYY